MYTPYLILVVALIIFAAVKLISHIRENSGKPKNAREDLTRTIPEALENWDLDLMKDIAQIYATGTVPDHWGPYEDRSVPKDPAAAERWYAMALEEQLFLRVKQHSFKGSYALQPFEQEVFRYCDGKFFPRDLNKALSIAEYLVRQNVAIGGQLVDYVHQLMKGKKPYFLHASSVSSWEWELKLFLQEKTRLAEEDRRRQEQFQLNGGALELWMEHQGITTLAGRIDWLLDMMGQPAADKPRQIPVSAGLRAGIALERKGNYKGAAAKYRRVSGPEGAYRLGLVYRRGISHYEGDKNWEKGTAALHRAASQGSAMAAYELGEEASVSEIAARAKAGDLEAIEALGCLIHRGQGGIPNPLIAWIIWGEGIRILPASGDPPFQPVCKGGAKESGKGRIPQGRQRLRPHSVGVAGRV